MGTKQDFEWIELATQIIVNQTRISISYKSSLKKNQNFDVARWQVLYFMLVLTEFFIIILFLLLFIFKFNYDLFSRI